MRNSFEQSLCLMSYIIFVYETELHAVKQPKVAKDLPTHLIVPKLRVIYLNNLLSSFVSVAVLILLITIDNLKALWSSPASYSRPQISAAIHSRRLSHRHLRGRAARAASP